MLHGSSRRLLSPPFPFSLSNFDTHDELVDYFDQLLQWSASIHHSKQIHSQITVTGSFKSGFLAGRLVSVYSRFGSISDARKVFEMTQFECFNSNLLLWNSILRANVTNGDFEETIRFYCRMRILGLMPDGFTFPLVVRACASIGCPNLGRYVHSHVVQMGLQDNVHVVNELIGMYGKLGWMNVARKLFDKMPARNHISWNTLISGFAYNCDCDGALETFKRMESEGLEPNIVSWTSLLSSYARCGRYEETLKWFGLMRRRGNGANPEALAVVLSACADLRALVEGKVFHGYVIRGGFDGFLIVTNSLIGVYGHGDLSDARRLFKETKVKNVVGWNSLITAYAESGSCDKALELFSQLKNLDGDTTLRPNVITWSSVIGGFASRGRAEEALELFRRMQQEYVTPNSVTVSSVLSACAQLALLPLGKQIHAYAIRALIDRDVLVSNGLINMYTKCGALQQGHLVFERTDNRDLITWNTVIAGYGMHGYGEDSSRTFEQMIEEGFTPDKVTFVAVLSACAHAGYVAEGRNLFNRMKEEFKIEPEVEHYACMVDLLGRAGLIDEANEMVKNMPMEPNECVLGALLNSIRVCKNPDIAEQPATQIFDLDDYAAGSFMLLSNIYAARGQWDESARVRLSAKTKGLKKTPGQTWIEVKKKVYVFSSGKAPVEFEEVYRVLDDLGLRMEFEGYVPDKSYVLQNVDEDEKKRILNGHSEKLAIAFGHVYIPQEMPIRIMKNLRVCGDCHNWTKYFTRVTGREVVVRDARRFHHFVDGRCSCRDYW